MGKTLQLICDKKLHKLTLTTDFLLINFFVILLGCAQVPYNPGTGVDVIKHFFAVFVILVLSRNIST
jgi:hypothetical protein